MARTAPLPNIPAIPGMNPGTWIMGGGGAGGGGNGDGNSSAARDVDLGLGFGWSHRYQTTGLAKKCPLAGRR